MAHPKDIKNKKKRPLFQNNDKTRKLFKSRLPLYKAKADIIINVVGKSTKEIADELLTQLKVNPKFTI